MPDYEYALVTAFTSSQFGGNPALVVFLDPNSRDFPPEKECGEIAGLALVEDRQLPPHTLNAHSLFSFCSLQLRSGVSIAINRKNRDSFGKHFGLLHLNLLIHNMPLSSIATS